MPRQKEQLPPSDFRVTGEQGWGACTVNLEFSPTVDPELIHTLILQQDVSGVEGIQSIETFSGALRLRVNAVSPQLFVDSIAVIYERVRRSTSEADFIERFRQ